MNLNPFRRKEDPMKDADRIAAQFAEAYSKLHPDEPILVRYDPGNGFDLARIHMEGVLNAARTGAAVIGALLAYSSQKDADGDV